MKKRFLFIALSLIILLVSAPAIAAVVYESHTSGESTSVNYVNGANWWAQTFTASENHSATGIRYRLGYVGSYPAPANRAHLRATSGAPTGADLTIGTFNGTYTHTDNFSNTEWEYIWFDSSVNLTDGVVYAALLSCPTCDGSNRPYIASDSDASDEFPGTNYRSSDSGVTWPVSYVNDDTFFQILGGLQVPVITTDNVTDVVFNDFFGNYDATFHATLDDDGGEANTITWYYQVKGSGVWGTTTANSTYTTGQSANTTNEGQFLLDTTYEYYATAANSEEGAAGATLEFTPTLAAGAPVMITHNIPLTIDTDNLTARLYGRVSTDGTANVTGYFYYRQYGAGSWITSDNTTDLVTGSEYNILVTANLTLGNVYQFQAAGVNIHDEGLGAIGQFEMTAISAPAVTTLPADFIENNQARLSANVTDMGNDPELSCRFQFREAGSHTWIDTAISTLTAPGVYTRFLYGLDPVSNYEYRAKVTAGLIGGDSYTAYGDILSFNTLATYSIPIMVTQNGTYVSPGYVRLDSYVSYDGGSPVEVYAEYRIKGSAEWAETNHGYGAVTGDTVWLFTSGLVNEQTYEYRSVGENEISPPPGYGSIREFYLTDESVTQPGDDDTPAVTGNFFIDWINNLQASWGLTGTLGTWAFMFILILITAIPFIFFMLFTREDWAKKIIGATLAALEIIIIGGFLFSGRLGLWPVAILVFVAATIALFIFGKLGK